MNKIRAFFNALDPKAQAGLVCCLVVLIDTVIKVGITLWFLRP